jgi:glutamine---fructose-6-phosphate transaminase (isomerizing)
MCYFFAEEASLAFDTVTDCHVGIAHTRWATHGVPNTQNAHPQRSDEDNTFCLVHNGIITNYKDIKLFLAKKGFTFESDTDTEVIAKLTLHVYQNHPESTFQEIVELTIQQLVSSEFLF